MQLNQPQESHLLQMLNWFENERSIREWAGPDFRFPFNLASFTDDLQLDTFNSFVLISTEGEFVGFGQFYARLKMCHLAWLVVNPQFRGKGHAADLITLLCDTGNKKLNLNEYSLFVLAHNESAIKPYTRYGFEITNSLSEMPLANCLYMVKTIS